MRWILFLVVLLVAGCGGRFDSATLVERLRILGVRAEPPAVGLDDDVELSALVADPAGDGRALSFAWKACLYGPTASPAGCTGSKSYPIAGDGLSVSLSMSDLAAWLEGQGISPDDLPVEEVILLIELEVVAGDESVLATKYLKVLLREDAPRNQNPVLDGFLLDGEEPGPGPIVLPARSKHVLKPVVGPGSRELFLPPDEEEEKLEEHLFSWYSTGGSFSDGRTILDIDKDGNNLDINKWTAPKEPGIITLWLVVRDGRYGLDWLSVDFEVAADSGS